MGTIIASMAGMLLGSIYSAQVAIGGTVSMKAFVVVILGGMGSFVGALIGGFLVGVVESLGGLYLGESLGQIGIFAIFIGVVLFRPQGMFGAKA